MHGLIVAIFCCVISCSGDVLAFISVYIILCSMYYWLVSRHSQVISPEEEAVMFIA